MNYGEGKTREQEARDSQRMLGFVLIYTAVALILIAAGIWLIWT